VTTVLASPGPLGLDWVDAIVIVVVLLAALRGRRLGAVAQILSYGGFWAGLFVGSALAPLAVGLVHTLAAEAAVALVVVFGAALVGAAVGRGIGWRARHVLRRVHLGPVDSLGGVAVAAGATLLACWVAATILVVGPSSTLSSGIARSRVLRGLDAALPPAPAVVERVRQYADTTGLPQVFSDLGVPLAGAVRVAGGAAVRRAVAEDGPSMVQVEGSACGEIQEGSGFVVAPHLVVTNAHVVAGVAHPVAVDRHGASHPAVAVAFDPRFDLAVLSVPALDEPAVHIDPAAVRRGATAAVLGYPEGGPFSAGPAGIVEDLDAIGPDIYGQGSTTRRIYAIRAVVRPGNSGGPLVGPGGQVVGVVFSRSTTNPDLGYALASPGVLARVRRAEAHPGDPGTGRCVTGG
jgi:S1-C subfamily serine protease